MPVRYTAARNPAHYDAPHPALDGGEPELISDWEMEGVFSIMIESQSQFQWLNFTNRGIYTCSQCSDGPGLTPDDTYAT